MAGNNVAEDFGRRMRERMPSHNVWHRSADAPSISRPANDALWDDLRSRLRSYNCERQGPASRGAPHFRLPAISRTGGRTTAVILAALALLILAFLGLLR